MGYSQAQLAQLIRVNRRPPTRSYICRIESGEIDPRWSVVRSLARALRCQPWQLVAEVYHSTGWWSDYLALGPTQKRQVQHYVKWLKEGRG